MRDIDIQKGYGRSCRLNDWVRGYGYGYVVRGMVCRGGLTGLESVDCVAPAHAAEHVDIAFFIDSGRVAEARLGDLTRDVGHEEHTPL